MNIRLIVALIIWSAPAALAQEVTGQIEGRVRGFDSAAVSSAHVTATSPSLLGQRTTMTGEDGRFFLRGLAVGTYRVQVRRIGYRPVTVDSVHVWLGTVTALAPVELQAQPAVELEPVVIVPDDDALDPSRTSSSVVLGSTRLSELPLGRNFREIAMLLPQATPSFLGDGINIAGGTGPENHYYVDGIDITNPIFGDKSIDLPYNFIHQIQVHTGGATAEDPMTLGGTVNVVTPSGGNEFAGSAFGFFSSSGLQSKGRTAAGGTQSGFSFYDAGVTLSGPVARDRVWFFAAYNPRFERRDFSYSFGPLEDITRVHQFAGKLTAALGANTTGVLTILGDPRRSTPVVLGFVPVGPTPIDPGVLTRKDEGGRIGGSARVQSQLGRSLLLEAALSSMSMQESGTPTSGTLPPFVNAQAGTISGGHGHGYEREARRQAAATDLSYQRGDHNLTAGIRYEVLSNQASLWVETLTFTGPRYIRLITTADARSHLENRNPSLFLQDAWQLTDRLSITAGARLSRQDIVNHSGSIGGFRVHDGVQPRVGVVYQVGRPGTQRIFASYARVVQQIYLSPTIQYQRGKTLISAYPQDPRVDSSNATTLFEIIRTGNGAPIDGPLRPTSVDQWSVGYARHIREGLTLSASGERRVLGEHLALGANDGNPAWGNPGRRSMSAFPRPNRRYNALHIGLRRLQDSEQWWQLAYTFSRTHGNLPGIYDPQYRLPSSHHGPHFDRSSTWQNATGLLPNDRTHLFKAYGSRALGHGLIMGGSILASSGTPLSEHSLDGSYLVFSEPRGTAGRTPWIWDASLRAAYEVPARFGTNSLRLITDIQHLGNPRRAVDFDQLRFTCSANDSSCENATYGVVTQYQPPMTARLGIEVVF